MAISNFVKDLATRNGASTNKTTKVTNLEEDLGSKAVADILASIWVIEDVISLEAVEEANVYKQKFGDSVTYLMPLDVTNRNTKGAKNFYFTSATKNVSEWKQEEDVYSAIGSAKSAFSSDKCKEGSKAYEFHTTMQAKPTVLEQYNYLVSLREAGKKLKVVDIVLVTTARYRNNIVVGLRTANIPVFEIID